MKRILFLFAALAMFTGNTVIARAIESTARSITIFKVEGDVEMTKGTAKRFTAKDGMKLADGYTVATGVKSHAWLLLDGETLIKMDQRSKVSVSKASASKLSVTVLSGAVSVDAATQKDGNSLEVRAGNSALAVRGTSFVIDCQVNGATKFIMISGSGTVGETTLEAGMMLTVTVSDSETGEATVYDLTELTVDSDLGAFVIDALLEHRDTLISNNILTSDILDIIEEIKEEADKKQQEQENILTGSNQQEQSHPISQGTSQPPPPTYCVKVTRYVYESTDADGTRIYTATTQDFESFSAAMAYVYGLPESIGYININVYGDCRTEGNHTIGRNQSNNQVILQIDARLLVEGRLTLEYNGYLQINPTGVLAGTQGATLDFTEANTSAIDNHSPYVYFLTNGATDGDFQALEYTYTSYNGSDAWDTASNP